MLLKTRFGLKQKKTYKSIYDLPMYNWINIRRDDDLSYLYVNEEKHKIKLKDKESKKLYDLYLDMMTEFYKEFGQSKDTKEEIKLKRKIIDLNIKYIETGDRFVLNSVKLLETDLLALQTKNIEQREKMDTEKQMKDQIAFVSSALRTPINLKKISVLQFYTQLSMTRTTLN